MNLLKKILQLSKTDKLKNQSMILDSFDPDYWGDDSKLTDVKIIKKITLDNSNSGYLVELPDEVKVEKLSSKYLILFSHWQGVSFDYILKKPFIIVKVFLSKKTVSDKIKKLSFEDIYYFSIARATIEKR